MNIKTHYKNQKEYFNNEFSQVSTYTLAAWQKSYIEKIKQYVLDSDYRKKTRLDIGTRQGYIAVEMAQLGLNVIACDLSPKAIENLEILKKRLGLKNLKAFVCNAEEIPLKPASVDYIVANALLEHLPYEEKAIANWKSILRKGGRMFITVPLSLKYVWPILWLINIIHDRRLGHLRRYDAQSLKQKISLRVVRIFYTGHIIKVLGAIFSIVFKTKQLDQWLEIEDRKSQFSRYGANNISIIFEK